MTRDTGEPAYLRNQPPQPRFSGPSSASPQQTLAANNHLFKHPTTPMFATLPNEKPHHSCVYGRSTGSRKEGDTI